MTGAPEQKPVLPNQRDNDAKPPRFRPRGRILPAKEVEGYETAAAFMEAARHEAESQKANATSVLETARRQGFEQGRLEGAKAAAGLLAETKRRADQYLARADLEIVDLALAVVREVLGEFDVEKLTREAVRHGLEKQRQDQQLTLYVSPDMADPVRAHLDQEIAPDRRPLITVDIDPKLDLGQCRLASEIGFVELGVQAQLSAIHQGLKAGLDQRARE